MTQFITNIYIYSDKYYTKVLASYRIEVQSLACVYVQTEAGVDNPLNLILNSYKPQAQKVELHSSNTELVRVGNKENIYYLLPRATE